MSYCCETNDGGRNVSRTLAWSEIGCVNCSLIVDTPYFEYTIVDQVDTPRFTYAIASAVADVTFTPTISEFAVTVDVALATTTPGAAIYYTLDGSAPDNTDTLYTGPITITTDTLIRARAYLSPLLPSGITQQQMTALVPQTLFIERTAPASVFWSDLYSEAALTITVGAATHLIVYVDGSACTFDLVYNGTGLFGPVAMGADATDGNTYNNTTTLSGAASTVILAVGLPFASLPGYFRAGGNTYSAINVNIYTY